LCAVSLVALKIWHFREKTSMTENSARTPQANRVAAAQAAPSRAQWHEPKIVRIDVAMTDTVLNAVPDGDTSS